MQTFIEKYNLRAELDSLFDSYPYEELNKIYNLHEREYEIGLILITKRKSNIIKNK